jgi:hypothetical protein
MAHNDDLFPDADADFDVKPSALSLSSSMQFSRFGVTVGDDDDGDTLRALLLQDSGNSKHNNNNNNNNSNGQETSMPMQSSGEGLFVAAHHLSASAASSTTTAVDIDALLLQAAVVAPPPMLIDAMPSTSVSTANTVAASAPAAPAVAALFPGTSVTAFGSLPVAATSNQHHAIHLVASPPQISIATSPPRFVALDGAAPVLDSLELDAERLCAAVSHLCTAYVTATAPHERVLCVEHARRTAAELHLALTRAFGLRRRVVLADSLSRWQRLADRLHAALMQIRLLSDVEVLADGTATNADAIGALIVEEQTALPCAAMSKRQRPEGVIVVRWVCSPVAIVAAGGAAAAPRPRSVRVTIDVADDVARDSFVHNVLGGEVKQFFKDSELPLADGSDVVAFPLSFVNGTTGHVVCAQFEASLSFGGQQHVVRSARTRSFALATHTRQWAGSSTALLLSCLLQQDEFVSAEAGADDVVKDIRLDVPLTPEVGSEADDELSGESSGGGGSGSSVAPATARRKARARDDGPVRRAIVGGRKRASSDAGKRNVADAAGGGGSGGGGTAAAAALLAHAAGTVERERQAISPAYFGNVLAEHFERHARFDEHEASLKASPLSTVRGGLATSDVHYLLERLRVFAATLDPSARLLERALARFSEWFGAVLTMVRFQRPVAPLLAKGVVFGFMSRTTAERAVQGQARGTCVLRFAERHSSHFAIAYVGGGGGDGRVRHYLLTDADMVKGVADFVLRKPHFSHVLRFAGVDTASGAVRLQVLEKRSALQFVAESTTEEQPTRPIHEGYESLD